MNYFREVLTRELPHRPETHGYASKVAAHLEAGNPIMQMSAQAYRDLLQTLLSCVTHAKGSPSTKIERHLAAWLDVLSDAASPMDYPFKEDLKDWVFLAAAEVDPLVACCYRRMVRDLEFALTELNKS